MLALRIFKEEIQAQENGTHLYIENSDQWCSLVCLYSPYLKEELQSIFNDIIKNKWIDYKDPYHHLSEFIVKKANTSLLLPIAILYHGVVPDLLQLYWEERLDDKDHNSWKISCFPTNSLYRPNIFSSFSHSPSSHGNWISCS